MVITSINNERVKYYTKLRQTKYIKEENLFIVEGEHLVNEALSKNLVKEIILLDGIKKEYNVPVIFVKKSVLNKISLLDSVPDVMAVCYVKEEKIIGDKIILLDNVRDPGNVGTIIRNACAFNIDTVVLSEGSVNKYNDKLIRSTQGMFFKVNIVEKDLKEVINEFKSKNIKIIGTSLDTNNELKNLRKENKYAIVLGNEGKGISKDVLNMCDDLVFINISSSCESLNVACASAIIMYYMEG